MAKSKNKYKIKKGNRFTSLKEHKRYKSILKSPLSELNIERFDWERDLLPEYLWIDLLAQEYKNLNWHKIYSDFLDRLEDCINEEVCLFGFITDFGFIPIKAREQFLSKNKDFIYHYFYKPIGNILTLYSENPANWLLIDEWKNIDKIEPFEELKKLSKSVERLIKGNDLYTSNLRVMPLSRIFKHNKIHFSKNPKIVELVELLPKYPNECTDKEKKRVQSFARSSMNIFLINEKKYNDKKWPKYFWRHNYDLVPCNPCSESLEDSDKDIINKEVIEKIKNDLLEESNNQIEYLNKVGMQYKYDLYDSLKDEILLGLFSRVLQLYVVFLFDPNLWPRNFSSIFIRCIADTAITFAYLAKLGKKEDFKNFYEYSIGREKLLMLHLQDTFKEKAILDGRNYEEIGKELGEFNVETTEINLSSGWSKKSMRDLAISSGFEKIYKLLFDPASSDLHGSWTSIKKSNLVHCKQILHRFHRIPKFFSPPVYLDALNAAQVIYKNCLDIGLSYLNFPKPEKPLKDIKFLKEKAI